VWFVCQYWQVIFLFSKFPEHFWGPRSLLFDCYLSSLFQGYSGRSVSLPYPSN
jgi:hypothetical protein